MMKKLIITILCSLFVLSVVFASAWPGDTGTNIGSNLPSGYEPSGVIWHPYHNALFNY